MSTIHILLIAQSRHTWTHLMKRGPTPVRFVGARALVTHILLSAGLLGIDAIYIRAVASPNMPPSHRGGSTPLAIKMCYDICFAVYQSSRSGGWFLLTQVHALTTAAHRNTPTDSQDPCQCEREKKTPQVDRYSPTRIAWV
jgi:hypothetical protein